MCRSMQSTHPWFAITAEVVVVLVDVTDGALFSQSKTMLSVACGGMSGIMNMVTSAIQSRLSNLSFAPTMNIEKGPDTTPDVSGKSRGVETLSMVLPGVTLPNWTDSVVP